MAAGPAAEVRWTNRTGRLGTPGSVGATQPRHDSLIRAASPSQKYVSPSRSSSRPGLLFPRMFGRAKLKLWPRTLPCSSRRWAPPRSEKAFLSLMSARARAASRHNLPAVRRCPTSLSRSGRKRLALVCDSICRMDLEMRHLFICLPQAMHMRGATLKRIRSERSIYNLCSMQSLGETPSRFFAFCPLDYILFSVAGPLFCNSTPVHFLSFLSLRK